jgi:hypothetical protein
MAFNRSNASRAFHKRLGARTAGALPPAAIPIRKSRRSESGLRTYWVARPVLNIADRSFTTVIDWTVSNTTGATRRFNGFDWIATDGSSTLETIHDGLTFSVGNNATASFRTTLSSDTIIVQPWLGYNANIIRVGPFQAGDRAGLAQAAAMEARSTGRSTSLPTAWRTTGG